MTNVTVPHAGGKRPAIVLDENLPSFAYLQKLVVAARKRRMKRYLKRITDPSWYAYPNGMRAQALRRANWVCEVPGCNRRAMEVHHHTYERLWHEHPNDLCAICKLCHWLLHAKLIPANDNEKQLELPLKIAKTVT